MTDNIFTYFLVALLTFCATVLLVKNLIPIFRRSAKQPIYEGGPSWHIAKSGTPTMGGVGFCVPIIIIGLSSVLLLQILGNKRAALTLFISLIFALVNALIGFIDDITKLRHRENKGLSAKEKLFLQSSAVVFYLFARAFFLDAKTQIDFFSYSFDLGFFYYPLLAFILVGIINCANLTDGIDGLATSVAFSVGVSLFYYTFARFAASSFICALLIGATVGFLIFNAQPAKIFMGDTGSLFLGALVCSCALESGGIISVISVSTVYILEGISVVLQVIIFKATKKRLFKMAPLHHHLEKSGWSECKICIAAIFITLLSSLFGAFAFAV